ncbi:MAG: hypothetical protein GEU73_01320 [Chloroflexi bacterium]|nr:hypothetical protein [Chloroflexota bacterium]
MRVVRMVLPLAFILASATPVFADPAEPANASCVGIEASAISPPGSAPEEEEELAGEGMPGIVRFVRDGLGLQMGTVASRIAKEHRQTHAACDEGTEAIIGDLLS